MQPHHYVLLALLLVASGCPARDMPACRLGSLGCECTSAGQCEAPDLRCSQNRCLFDPGSSGPSGNADAASNAMAEPTPLPANQLLFLTTEATRGNGLVYQLSSYDVDSKATRIVTRLGDQDDGPSGLRDPHIALSPDRRWIAITADYFRLSEDQLKPSLIPATLTLVSVDGRQYRQVTPPISRNSPLTDFDANLAFPRWSPDGRQIYFRQCSTWRDAYAVPQLACLAKVVPAAGGEVRVLDIAPATFGCSIVGGAAPSPSGDTLLVPLSACASDSVQGVYEWTVEPFARKRKLVDVKLADTPIWNSDGSQIAFVAQRLLRDSQGTGFNAKTAFVWTASSQQTDLLYQPQSAAIEVIDVALSPDTNSFVIAVRNADGPDLYLNRNGSPLEKITSTKRSARPAW